MPTKKEAELVYAAGDGELEKVRQLLDEGVNVNATNEYDADILTYDECGGTPLIFASWNGHDAVVRLLLERGADVNKASTYGCTPLMYASWKGHDAVIRLLLQRGANVNKADDDGWTPLYWASLKGHDAVVQLLLERGGDVNKANNDGNTPLINASENGHDAIVRRLLDAGAELDPVNKDGKTALDWAKQKGHTNIVNMLEETNSAKQEKRHLAFSGQGFYKHIDGVAALVRNADENKSITIAPYFEKACKDMMDFLQLKYFFTAVNAQYRLGTITSSDRQKLILASLEKAKNWCTSPFHVAMYRVALRYSLSEGIINQFQCDQLDVAAIECDIANTDYIQAMQTIIRQNAARIDNMERVFTSFQQAVVVSIRDLQENVNSLNRDMHHMAKSINDVQANTVAVAGAFNQFAASMRWKKQVEAGCSLVSSILNAVSFGAAGSALQGVLGLTVSCIADFGDLSHLRDVAAQVGISDQALRTVGNITVQEMLDQGISLSKGPIANYKLNQAISEKNAIVVIAASAAVFTSTLQLDAVGEATAESSATQVTAEPSVQVSKLHSEGKRRGFKEPSGIRSDGQECVDIAPEPTREDLEKKLSSLEKKHERLVRNAKVAKELGKDDRMNYEAIEQVQTEIEELCEQLDSL